MRQRSFVQVVVCLIGVVAMIGVGRPAAATTTAGRVAPRATMTVGSAVVGQPVAVTVQVKGARISSAMLSVDSAAAVPLVASGRTATGSVTFSTVGTHTLSARIVVKTGRSTTAKTSVEVGYPTRTRFQLVYLYPAGTEPVSGRTEAIAHTAQVVKAWFAGQLGGQSPRFVNDGNGLPAVASVQSTLDAAGLAGPSDVVGTAVPDWQAQGLVPLDAMPIVFIEGKQGHIAQACGWSSSGADDAIVIPMGNCDIYPSIDAVFPYDSTYLLAHEMTHALGSVSANAPHSDGTGHVNDDPRDLLFAGQGGRDWGNLTIDPGHDDYYLTGRTDLSNLETSALLE